MLDDESLSLRGLTATAPPHEAPLLLIACGALAREVLALQRANAWTGMALACLPASLHNWPERIPEAVRERIAAGRLQGYQEIFVLYADCGTGGLLDKVCAEEGVERVPGPHCYAFFDGNDTFAARAEDEIGTFYLTDFLARQFDTLIWRGMALDRHPELRDMYFAHYDKVVYLAQTDDPGLTAIAEAGAEKLGLSFERRFTGYGELGGVLAGLAARRAPA